MPWWFWILLWVALAALTLLFLILLGFRVFRGFMAVMHDAERAGTRLGEQWDRRTDVQSAPDTAPAAVPGIFGDPHLLRTEYDDGKQARREDRRRRRVARRREHGQPVALRDLPGL